MSVIILMEVRPRGIGTQRVRHTGIGGRKAFIAETKET